MGRTPRCSNDGLNKGAWTVNEDKILVDYIKTNGEGRWSRVSRETGLKRCGKSCRLRWMNYLRPDIKRGNISSDEEELIIRLHKLLGNRWSLIAGILPGRTDNEIKNYWNTNLAKKASEVQLSQFRTLSRKPQNVATLPEYSLSVPLQAKPLDCRVSPNLNPDGGNSLLKQTAAAAYDSDFSDRSPSLSLNSTDDLMMNFNVDSDDICQILDSDFSQINQVYIDDLLSPEAELEVDAYINMVEDQDFRNRLSSCFESPEAMEKNSLNGGDSEEDCMIGSDFPSLASAFESDQVKWSGLGDGDNDLNIVFQEENATGN